MSKIHLRVLSLLLCLAMVLGMAPMIQLFTLASAEEVVGNENHGEHTEWTHIGSTTENVDALLAAGGNFILDSDITLAGTVQPTANLHICLNGKTIHSNTTMFKMRNATLTISDCSKGEPGKLQVSNAVNSDGGVVYLDSNGIFNLYNGTLTGHTGASCGGGVRANTIGAVFNMYGGSITGNSARTMGGAVYVYRGTFNMYGGSIAGNTAPEGKGNCIYVNDHATYVSKVNISGNAVVDGLVVSKATPAKTELTIGKLASGANVVSAWQFTFDNNDNTVTETTVEGGWQYTYTDPHPEYTKIDGNTENVDALLAAGGEFMLTGDITLAGTVQPTANLHICLNGKTIHSNTTMFKMRNATLTISDCSKGEPGKLQVSNAVNSDGGIVYLDSNGVFNLYNGTLTGHTGASCGGGVRANTIGAVFNMYGGSITGNSARTMGGAVYVYRGTFNMYGGSIAGNTAPEGKGNCIYVNDHATYMSKVNISGNAVVDGLVVSKATPAKTELTIGELTPGANIQSSTALSVKPGDNTVKTSQSEGKYTYEFETSLFKNWVLYTEDFEGYTAGANAFYKDATDKAGAAYPYWGSLTETQYDIVSDAENRYLKMTSTASSKSALISKKAISGPYTMKMDFRFEEVAPNAPLPVVAITLTQGSALGGDIMAYVAPGTEGIRLYNSKDKVSQYILNADDSKMQLEYGTWYSMEYSLDLGSLTLAVWKTGDESTKLSTTLTSTYLSADILGSANTVRIDNTGNSNRTGIFCMDNLTLTKKIALNMQDFVTVEPGKVMTDLPVGDAANQLPAPTYSYTLENPEFGYVNNRGKLVAGYANADDTTVTEGETKLTLTLLDIRGNKTDITFETTLVVGTANGVSIGDDIQVPEADIGKTHTLTATVDPAVVTVPNDTIGWKSSDESVATVADGVVTYKGAGFAKITATVLDADGKETKYYGSINVQVGTKALKVLAIGNSFTTDTLSYLSQLAYAADARIEVGYLFRDSGTIRQHAYNLAYNVDDYAWYTSNANNGKVIFVADGVNLAEKVESQDWDVIILQQGVNYDGISNTYNADLEYLVDYLEDVQPNAKLYWNMTWALEDGYTGSSGHAANFTEYYGSDQKVMYNAIVRALDEMILGEKALFSSTNENNLGTGLGWGFDGCLLNGTAIQNLRETVDHDRDLTRDGYHLSYDLGRMVAGMNTLKTLYDDLALGGAGVKLDLATAITAAEVAAMIELSDSTDYKYSEADLPKIIAAATAAANVEGAPKQMQVTAPVKPEDVNENAQASIQALAPQKLHFPDIKTLENGTMLSIMLEFPEHAPTTNTSDPYSALAEGSSRILLYESADGGYTWNTAKPVLIVDEMQLQKWGIVDTYDRYSRIGACSSQNYNAMADVRDPNLGTAYVDFDGDGDKEEVVIVTFWINFYGANSATFQNRILLMLTGVRNADGSYTWAAPQKIQGAAMKRGDIASFSDESILIPVIGNVGGVIPMRWNAAKQSWDEGSFVAMPHPDPKKYQLEISLVAPDPDGQVVFAFCREEGTVLKSTDRGATWEIIGDEPGLIHQPGFAILDKDRVFVTWARTSYPRDIYGKVFYVNADWSDTATQLIYASSDRYAGNDTGDPSCAVNAKGEVVVISYDNSSRSIVFSIVDPDDAKWLPIEFSDENSGVIYESDKDVALSDTNAITDTVKPLGVHTVEATVVFKTAADKAVFATSAGSVTVTADGLALNEPTNIQIVVVGNKNYVKVWQDTEPDTWTVYTDAGTAAEQTSITGSGAEMTDVKISSKLVVELQSDLVASIGGADMQLSFKVQPAYAEYTFSSADEKVVTVDENGKVHIVGEGKTVITMTVNGTYELYCNVIIKGKPAEVTGDGNSNVLLEDDFQSYTPGTNALWNKYWENKESSLYDFENAKGMTSTSNGTCRYDITKENSGNQYLELNGKVTWFMTNEPITGNYTAQFDIMFLENGKTLNLTPWQNDPKVEGNEVHAFVNLQSNAVKFQICPEKLTDYPAGSGQNPYENYIGDNEPSSKFQATDGKIDAWQTVKLVRVDGGMYLKVWNTYDASGNRNPEPEEWTCTLTHGVLDTDMDSHIRFQYYDGTDNGKSLYIDNLRITQQTYKVTYDVDGQKETMDVLANTLLTAPAEPTKDGLVFDGWYNGDQKWNFELHTVESDITLTAKWIANKQYTVTFDSGVAAQTVEQGAKVTKPADPVKEGYTFAGWYNGDKLWDFDLDTVEQDMTLTAKWEVVQDGDGGSDEGGSNEGGSNEGGSNEGGSNEGGSNEGGSNEGGNAGADDPSKTGDNTLMPSFMLLAILSITALAVIVIGKKKLF